MFLVAIDVVVRWSFDDVWEISTKAVFAADATAANDDADVVIIVVAAAAAIGVAAIVVATATDDDADDEEEAIGVAVSTARSVVVVVSSYTGCCYVRSWGESMEKSSLYRAGNTTFGCCCLNLLNASMCIMEMSLKQTQINWDWKKECHKWYLTGSWEYYWVVYRVPSHHLWEVHDWPPVPALLHSYLSWKASGFPYYHVHHYALQFYDQIRN